MASHKNGAFSGTSSDLAVREILSAVMDECGKSREAIAAELSVRLGRHIGLSILNDYTRRTRTGARFPAAYIAAFCEVTGDDRLRKFLLPPRVQAVINLGSNVLNAIRDSRREITEILDEEARTGRRIRL